MFKTSPREGLNTFYGLSMYFILFQNPKNNRWYWSLKNNDHQTIAAGVRGYANKGDALDSVDLVRRNAPLFSIYDKSLKKWL